MVIKVEKEPRDYGFLRKCFKKEMIMYIKWTMSGQTQQGDWTMST
jgi:hypothetical protein